MFKKSASIWVFLALFSVKAKAFPVAEGGSCNLHNGERGVCKSVSKCNRLHAHLEDQSISFRDIVLCGFNASEPITCCRDVHDEPKLVDQLFWDTDVNGGATDIDVIGDIIDEFPNRYRMQERKTVQACQTYSKEEYPSAHILFGRAVPSGECPHIAALGYPNEDGGYDFDCGGTIISELWVITAAHCVKKKKSPTLVRMGVILLNDEYAVDRTIVQKIRHPSYRPLLKQNDIALLQLDAPIVFSEFVRPACIDTQLDDVPDTIALIVAGWGSTNAERDVKSMTLQEAEVSVVPIAACNATLLKFNELPNHSSLRNGLLDSQLCTLDTTSAPRKLKDACNGDSGGPLFIRRPTKVPLLVGVVSFGVSCGARLPSVYTRIASYVDWIESVVWP